MYHHFCQLQNLPGQRSNVPEAGKARRKFSQSLGAFKKGGLVWLCPINTRQAWFLHCPPAPPSREDGRGAGNALDPRCLGWNPGSASPLCDSRQETRSLSFNFLICEVGIKRFAPHRIEE